MTLTTALYPRYGLRNLFAEGHFLTFAEFFYSDSLLTLTMNVILIIIAIKIHFILS